MIAVTVDSAAVVFAGIAVPASVGFGAVVGEPAAGIPGKESLSAGRTREKTTPNDDACVLWGHRPRVCTWVAVVAYLTEREAQTSPFGQETQVLCRTSKGDSSAVYDDWIVRVASRLLFAVPVRVWEG